jgi:hypothetical protein
VVSGDNKNCPPKIRALGVLVNEIAERVVGVLQSLEHAGVRAVLLAPRRIDLHRGETRVEACPVLRLTWRDERLVSGDGEIYVDSGLRS